MDKKPEKLVPEVRFKGFTDDWEQRKLGEISKRVRNNDGRMNLPLLTISARYGWMTQQSRFSASIAGREKKNYTLLEKHQLSYNHGNSKVAIYGTVYELTNYDEALVPKVYHSFSLTPENSSKFIESYFHTKKLDAQLRKFIASTARMDGLLNISFDDFMKVKLFAPEQCEQSKISRIINLIEKLITLQQRKLKQLKQLKKAMLQQLFVDKNSKQPNLRFKNFNSDWKQRKLKNISKRILRKNSDLQSLLPLTISAQDGLVDQTLYFNKQVASKQLKNYLLLYNGDFAYNKSYSVGYPYGAIKRLDKYKQGVLSTLYIAFKPTNINSDFLQHYYDTDKWYREIYRNAAEGARNHGLLNISANDFFNSKLVIPSDNDEQLKIAKIINLFNHLITLRQDNLTQLTILKKYLLQKLFI